MTNYRQTTDKLQTNYRQTTDKLQTNYRQTTDKLQTNYRLKTLLMVRLELYSDAIHQLDKLNSFPAIAFELVSSMARDLGL